MKQTSYISRRRFLRHLGYGAAGIAGTSMLSLAGCRSSDDSTAETENDGKMTYRVNHNTGDSVSLLGYGCMRLPTRPVKDGKNGEDEIDQEAVNRQVDYALEHGVNYFDTSPVYCKGRSEAAMGKALSRHPRDSYYLATKLSNFAPETWSHEASVKIFENSLKNLQTEYVDYLLLHAVGMNSFDALNGRYLDNGILEYLLKQKAQGKIRNLGFSYHGDPKVFSHLLEMMDRGDIHWDFVQIQLNYIDWNHAGEANNEQAQSSWLYDELHKRNIPVVIMEPLLGGMLASASKPVTGKMKQRRPEDSPASWAFRFAGSPEGVLTVLSGMTLMEHLVENIETFSPLAPLSDEEMDFLELVAEEILHNENIACTGCKYCLPCKYGVDIPSIFSHYNRCVNDDNVSRSNRDPRYAEARKAFLVGYDRKVPKLRQAGHCIGCGECLGKCPQGIPIPEKLHQIDQYVTKLKSGEA